MLTTRSSSGPPGPGLLPGDHRLVHRVRQVTARHVNFILADNVTHGRLYKLECFSNMDSKKIICGIL